MAGMIYSHNRHSARHITCSLLYVFSSMWFFGVFTSVIIYPKYFNMISLYWVNGGIAIGSLLSLHLWLMNANLYNKKNGKYLKLLFVPGIVMLMTLPFESWMLKGDVHSIESVYIPGTGLYLLWLVDFSYLFIVIILTILEMKKGNNAAKLWFKGIVLYFVWIAVTLSAALLFENTSISNFFYFIMPHGTLLWAIAIFISMSRFDYLSSYERRYNILFQRSPIGILMIDEEAIVHEVSPQVPNYLGVTREELIQSSLLSFLSGIDRQTFIQELQRVFKQQLKLENVEISFVNRLGKQLTLLIDSDFIIVEGRTLQFVIVKDITETKAKEERVQYLAYNDLLTGLSNRAAFEKQINDLLSSKEKFNLLLLDLNKLKQINDTFGHQAGDHAIQHIANILQEVTEEKHHAARLGGDEFVLLLAVEETEKIIENIQHKLAIPLKLFNQNQISLSASMGISCYPLDGETIDELYSVADKRMYLEKHSARKC